MHGTRSNWNRLQVEFAKRGGKRFHFHDLRAKYVSDKEERGKISAEELKTARESGILSNGPGRDRGGDGRKTK